MRMLLPTQNTNSNDFNSNNDITSHIYNYNTNEHHDDSSPPPPPYSVVDPMLLLSGRTVTTTNTIVNPISIQNNTRIIANPGLETNTPSFVKSAGVTSIINNNNDPARNDALPSSNSNNNEDENITNNNNRNPPIEPPPFINHRIQFTDTLEGIAIAYGVQISDIKKHNKLFTSEVHERAYLIIPNPKFNYEKPVNEIIDPEKEKLLLIKKFQWKSGCKDMIEARAYMNMYNFDVERAAEQFKKDMVWESTYHTSNPQKIKKNSKSHNKAKSETGVHIGTNNHIRKLTKIMKPL